MKYRVHCRGAKVLLCFIVLIAMLAGIAFPTHAAAKYMEGKQADFSITLDASGGALIRETWKCYFGGDTISRYRRNYTIADPSVMDIEIRNVSMDGTPMTILDTPDKSRPQGCAAVYREDNSIHVEMYLRALEEIHTFEITYYVTNAVTVYEDAAEFHWNLTSQKESFDIEALNGFIEIPYGTRDKGLYFWGHGPSENAFFDARVQDGMVNQFDLHTENISRGQTVMVRFAMPAELFPNCTRTIPEPALQRILEEEHANIPTEPDTPEPPVPTEPSPEEPYEEPWYASFLFFFTQLKYLISALWLTLAAALCFVPILLSLLFSGLLRKLPRKFYLPKMYRKLRLVPQEAPEYYRSLPDQMKPALVYKLMTVYPVKGEGEEILKKGNAFAATILDLAEADLLKIGTDAEGKVTYLLTPEAQNAPLTEYEKVIVELYTAAGADQEPMSTDRITAYMRNNYRWSKDQYQKFDEAVSQAFADSELEHPYGQHHLSKTSRILLGVLTGLFLFLGLISTAGPVISLIVAAAIGWLDTRIFIQAWETLHPDFSLLTQEGENRYALWKAYDRFLKDFTTFQEREVTDIRIWRKYLVYAAALGCSEKVIENLKVSLPEVYQSFATDPYLYRYEDMYLSASAIDTEGGYTIRPSSSSGSSWSSSDSSDWGGFSDGGGDSDSGSSGSDFD